MRRVSAYLGGVVFLAALGWCLDLPVEGRAQTRGAGTPVAGDTPLAIPTEATEYRGILDVTDADARDDVWFVLDGRASRVHVLGRETGVTTSFGRGGSGEGELARPSALVLHADTVVVVERLGGLVHLFDTSGRHLADRSFQLAECRIPVVSDAVSTPDGLVFLVTCPGARLNTKAFAALEVTGANARVLASTASRPTPRDRIDPFFAPVLASHRDGIAFGAAGDACLSVVDLSGVTVGEECATWLERLPLPAAERAQLARLRVRLATLAARLESADALPPFDALFRVGASKYAYRAPTRLGGASRQLRIEPGSLAGGTRLPVARFAFSSPGTALLAWEGVDGLRIARYDLPK